MTHGEQLLKEGQDLREAGQTQGALAKFGEALEAFAAENDMARFAHTLLDRAICWQHLRQFHNGFHGFAVLYKHDAEAMLELVEKYSIETERDGAYLMVAKARLVFGQYAEAVQYFEKAIAALPQSRPAQKGDWVTALGKAQYLTGQKEQGVNAVHAGIEQLKAHEGTIDSYMYLVWLSGAYMRLAEMLRTDNPEQSQAYLQQAKEIITSDSRLTVRQKQLDAYIASGESGL